MNTFWEGFSKEASLNKEAFNPIKKFKALKRLERMRASKGMKDTATKVSPLKKYKEGYNKPKQKALRFAGKGILGVGALGAGAHYLTQPLEQKNVGYGELHRRQRYAR